MNKTILIDGRFIGGGSALGRYAENLILELLKLDHNFEIRPILKSSNKKNIPTILKKANPVWVDIDHYSIAEQLRLPKIIKAIKPDLIHYAHFNAPIFSPKPFVVTIHDLTISSFRDANQTPLQRTAYSFLLNKVSKKASHIITISETTKKDIEKILKVSSGKISVVYLGIEDKFKPQNEKEKENFRKKLNLDFPYVMYAGQWRPHKNLLRLFEAFAILKKEYKIAEKLVLFGKPDSRYPEIMNKIKELNLENEVVIAGFIDDDELPLAYSAAKLYVIPSLAEGFGFPPLEAMACGTPVAASFISCLPETLDESAIFFDPHDERDMAVKIHSALNNQNLRQVLVERGLVWVKRYTWQKTAQATLRIYEQLLQD